MILITHVSFIKSPNADSKGFTGGGSRSMTWWRNEINGSERFGIFIIWKRYDITLKTVYIFNYGGGCLFWR